MLKMLKNDKEGSEPEFHGEGACIARVLLGFDPQNPIRFPKH